MVLVPITALLLICCVLVAITGGQNCAQPSLTTCSGRSAPTGPICSYDLIFEDLFQSFNTNTWHFMSTIDEVPNGEFEWYTDNSINGFTQNGMLVIAPTLTTDVVPNLAAHKLHKQTFLPSANNIVKPVQSARIQSNGGFSFKYGYVEIAAKLPTGDWLWPAIWMEAQLSVYGKWPMSGEIDVMESRGNLNYVENGVQIGVQHIGSTLHFGTNATNDAWRTAHSARQKHGLNAGYYVYGLEWTPDYIRFTLDHQLVGVVETGAGFYKRGKFTGPNPWANGSINAPFDEEFFFIFDLAVGGTSGYFPNKGNANGKPWKNASPTAKQDFWNGRAQWLPSWNFDPNAQQTSTFQIDYIRVYAL